MIILNATTKKLELETGAAVSTDFYAAYADITTTAFTAGASDGNVATATTTDLVAAPGASTQRQIKFLSIHARAGGQTVRVKLDVSGVERYLTSLVTLGSGESLIYTDTVGWQVLDASGSIRAGVITLPDGDYGDVTVSGSGTSIVIDPAAVTYAKIQDVSATDRLLGRVTAGAGDVEEITCTAAGRAVLDDADAAAQRTTLGAAAASHTHAQSEVTSLVSDLALKAPLASPTLTGIPAAPTASPGENTTQVATTAFVTAAVAAVINSAPGALDTLDELAAALGDDANYAATITTALSGKQPLDAGLSSLAALGATAGLIEKTATDTYAERLLGVGAGTSIPTRADADTRYAAAAHNHDATELTAGIIPDARMPDLTGDVTTTEGAVATTIAAAAVTLAKMANIATATFIGRTTAGTGVPEALTVAQATALLNAATATVKGLVPTPPNNTTDFLRGDATWATPAGGGGGGASLGLIMAMAPTVLV